MTNFDFYSELKNALLEEDNQTENTCLISRIPLTENFIELECSHKFNYNAIFNEVRNQKIRNHLESIKLRDSQIKCPYCRSVQSSILPFYPELEPLRIRGVNSPLKFCMGVQTCTYEFKLVKIKENHVEKIVLVIFVILIKNIKKIAKNNNIQEKCTEILKNGKQCSRNLKKQGLCMQHYNLHNPS